MTSDVFGGGGSAPRPPDPEQLIRRQAQVNRVDQSSPFGSFTFSGPDRNQLDITLSPAQQALLEQQQGLGLALGSQAQRFAQDDPFRGLQSIEPLDRQRVEQSVFDRARGLLDPVFQDQERALEQSLANRGLPTGSEAFSGEFGDFRRSRNEAFQNAALQAVQFGGQEQSRQLADALRSRQQGISEMFAPLQGLQAGISGTPLQLPQMQNVSPVDVMGPNSLAFQGELNRFNQDQQNNRSVLGGLTQLGGALGSAAILGPAGPAAFGGLSSLFGGGSGVQQGFGFGSTQPRTPGLMFQ